MWFTTFTDGIYKYDDAEFINFTTKDGLCSNKVNSVIEGTDGLLWFATAKGLCSYNGRTFTNFPLPQETIPSVSVETGFPSRVTEEVLSLIQDKTGKIWVGSFRESTVSWFDGRKFTSVPFEKDQKLVELRFITEDEDGNVWFGGRYGMLYRYNGKELKDLTQLKRGE